jgi:predicted amidophosphoribosyltransferase
MSAEPAPEPTNDEHCPLCGAPVEPRADRCESCGMTLAGMGSRPGPFSRRSLWLWAAVVCVIYTVALVIVATVH